MTRDDDSQPLDVLTLRFDGENPDGAPLHELRAAHVAEVLDGLTELTEDFEAAGVFHDEGPQDTNLYVRPAEEGSFLLEVFRMAVENPEVAIGVVSVTGVPSIGTIIRWATKSLRADVEDFDRLENGNVKVKWQDGTAEEIPEKAWKELNKKKRRRKKQLRKIMAPLEDPRVNELEVAKPEEESLSADVTPYSLTKADFAAVAPEDDIEEDTDYFEVEARMSAIDFDNPDRWRVKTKETTRTAKMEDTYFLKRISENLAIGRDDVFRLRIQEDRVKKNGRTTTTWTILHVEWEEKGHGEAPPEAAD